MDPGAVHYTFRRCPYAMRARMALLQAGRVFEAVEVSLRDNPASLLALSPKASVADQASKPPEEVRG
jgi:glutathione S-transferase